MVLNMRSPFNKQFRLALLGPFTPKEKQLFQACSLRNGMRKSFHSKHCLPGGRAHTSSYPNSGNATDCGMAHPFLQADRNAKGNASSVGADREGTALFFINPLSVNTDGA